MFNVLSKDRTEENGWGNARAGIRWLYSMVPEQLNFLEQGPKGPQINTNQLCFVITIIHIFLPLFCVYPGGLKHRHKRPSMAKRSKLLAAR